MLPSLRSILNFLFNIVVNSFIVSLIGFILNIVFPSKSDVNKVNTPSVLTLVLDLLSSST